MTNQSPGTGINYANNHLAMDQMTPNTFKKYLAGSSLGDSGEPWLPGQAAREGADLVLVQAPSHSPHHPAAEFSRVFIFHLLHLQLSKAIALCWREGCPLGVLQAWTAGNFERCFCLLLPRFLVFLTVPFWRRGCGEGAVRMRNTVLQLCLWSAYCYFATGDPAPRGPEGRLQGNVHLFLLPPPQFLFWPRCPLSCPPFFLNPAASSLLSACAVHSLLLISLAVHLFFGASDQGIPEPAAAGCARPRSVRLHPFAVNMHPYRCCPVSRVGCQQLFNLALLFEPAGFRGKKVVRKSSVIWRSSF